MPSVSMSPQEVSDYIAQAGRDAWRVPDVPEETPLRSIEKVGVIGAGTMGGGISMNFATVGIPVTILEREQSALDRGLSVVRGHYQRSADKGRFPVEEVAQRMGNLNGTLTMDYFADCDLIIEAVFEDMDLKQ
ncbi:MAG: 3-hydroxyacyl-CoA dehydrogenase NAD-binding domain-containing protein, partial [Pseudomonadota bacterium]